MFGKNAIVGRKYFEQAGDRLFIVSAFMTLQGEGPLRGEPAFFVRLAKCNLACSFCDTAFEKGDWFTYDELDAEIEKRIAAYFKGNVPDWAQYKTGGYIQDIPAPADRGPDFKLAELPIGRTAAIVGGKRYLQLRPRQMALVITGGEPMLQTNLGPFLETQVNKFAKIQIESNGTLIQPLHPKVILVCSPKCSEKDGVATKYLQPRPEVLDRADCLKFVMEAGVDYDNTYVDWKQSPYATIPDWAHEWRAQTGKPIFISPMNIYLREPLKSKVQREADDLTFEDRTTEEVISFWEPGLLNMEANQRNHEWAARYCVQNGFTFNVQIHLLASVA